MHPFIQIVQQQNINLTLFLTLKKMFEKNLGWLRIPLCREKYKSASKSKASQKRKQFELNYINKLAQSESLYF